MRRLADRLCDAMPAEHTSFLRSLKNSLQSNPSYPFVLAAFGALKAVETDGRSIVIAFPSFLQARS